MSVFSRGDFNETKKFLDSNCTAKSTPCELNCTRFYFYHHYISQNYDQAEKLCQQYINSGGILVDTENIMLAYVYQKLGKTKEFNDLLDSVLISLQDRSPDNQGWYYYLSCSWFYAMKGEKEKALEFLTKVADAGNDAGWHNIITIDPIFEDLRDDPEFKAIVKRMQDEKADQREIVREMNESGEIDL